jgi:two-component system, NtrC family, C4-dicarboxylate transport sensor histidine kinase DctB
MMSMIGFFKLNTSSIATRLGLAFGLIAAMTASVALVGWISFARIASNQSDITNIHLPSTISAAEFAEKRSALVAIAPALAQAISLEDVQKLKLIIEGQLNDIAKLVSNKNERLPPSALTLVSTLKLNIAALLDTVQLRLSLKRQADTGFEELRWLHADILDEAEPLIAEARNSVRQYSAEISANSAGRIIIADLNRIDALTDIMAQANLAAGLLARISKAPDMGEFSQTVYFLSETIDALGNLLARLDKNAEYTTLQEVTERLVVLASIQDGLPGFRRNELRQQEMMRRQLDENRALVSALDHLVAEHMAAVSQQARDAARVSGEALLAGRNLMTLSALAALLVSGGVGFGYVRRNIVARISKMAASGRALAAGADNVVIPTDGNDELTDMGNALAMYRASSADALSAEKRATEQLKRTQAELVQAAKLAALGQLSAGLGHELNQPIAAIRSFAHNGKILLDRNKPQDAALTLKRIEELTIRMSAIVGHLKRFARRPEQQLKAIRLRDSVADALSLFENRLRDRNITVQVDVADDLMVGAETVRLEQIVVNLVSNALDAVEATNGAVVRLSGKQTGHLVILAIEDNGSGIKASDQPHIFDPFFTTKPSGAGLGLGLSTSFNIARDFNGALRLARSSPQGTVFELILDNTVV